MMRFPDPDSVRWTIAAVTSPERIALVLSVIVVLIAVLILQAR